MKTISIWEDTANPISPRPSFQGNIEADVVIIGGGITGLTTALLLSDAGKKVVLLEANRIGLGTTGNSTGNLYVTVDEHLSVIKKKWSAAVMKSVVTSRAVAINLIEKNVVRFNIDCDFYRTSFNYFAESTDQKSLDFINDEAEALQESGLKVSIDSSALLPFSISKVLSVPGQAQFHPLNYARGLVNGVSARCEIYENSSVIDVDDKEGIVRTSTGMVKAHHIIMATHTPKGVFMIQTALGPYREHAVAAELNSNSMPEGIFWGIEPPKHSVRTFKKDGKFYVMVIGDKYKTGHSDDSTVKVAELEKYLRTHFDIREITHTWGGQQYRPADGLPYIGKHGNRTWFLTGFATDGLTYGTLGAIIVSDIITGVINPWEDLFKLNRFTPAKSFKEFFKENADVLVQYLKDVPGNSDSLKHFLTGEGKIVEVNGEKIAVYRDANNVDHVCSAVCTHMKCIVNWNTAEKTWDCPCHGSRFDLQGKVIEGPAVVNLATKKDVINS